MRKIQVVMLALFAVFAVSAMASATASAAELLSEGAAITALLFIAISGELLLEDMKASILGNPDLLCNGILDGMIESGGKLGFIEEALTLNGENLESNMLDCTDHNNLCSKGEAEKTLVAAQGLPWHFEILSVGGKDTLELLNETGKVPSYEATCETSLGTLKDLCETETGTTTNAPLANEAAGLLAEFSENETITAPGKCSLGGAQGGLLAGDGIITDPSGGALTAS